MLEVGEGMTEKGNFRYSQPLSHAFLQRQNLMLKVLCAWKRMQSRKTDRQTDLKPIYVILWSNKGTEKGRED